MSKPEIKIVDDHNELREALEIRRIVFIEEQNVPEQRERDEYDKEATQVILRVNGKAVGTARFRFIDKEKQKIKIERMAILKEFRGNGFGEKIMRFIEECGKKQGVKQLVLHSQWHARGFYEKFGFKQRGKIFMDADIEHIEMTKNL